jgi:hypothetical protein
MEPNSLSINLDNYGSLPVIDSEFDDSEFSHEKFEVGSYEAGHRYIIEF